MKVWVFVEGESDRIALSALWEKWRTELQKSGWGIQCIPLDGKSQFFKKIGPRAAEKLVNNRGDLVVGLPDLYPNANFADTEFNHANLGELKDVQRRLVSKALESVFSIPAQEANAIMKDRFHATALKHDFEVLLLAAKNELRKYLNTSEKLDNWRHPVEDQNHQHPPKYVVSELFRTKKHIKYRDTIHAKAVLEQVGDIKTLLYSETGQLECPVFKATMDWIASKTGVTGV